MCDWQMSWLHGTSSGISIRTERIGNRLGRATRVPAEEASVANSRDAQRDALRRLVADARDGHGGVYDARGASPRAILPILLGLIDKQV